VSAPLPTSVPLSSSMCTFTCSPLYAGLPGLEHASATLRMVHTHRVTSQDPIVPLPGAVQNAALGLSAGLLLLNKSSMICALYSLCQRICNNARTVQLYDEAGIPSRWAFSPVGSNYQTYNLQGLESAPGVHSLQGRAWAPLDCKHCCGPLQQHERRNSSYWFLQCVPLPLHALGNMPHVLVPRRRMGEHQSEQTAS
jgi:hypothetical protein